MTTRSTLLRKASARLEALETRSLLSGEIDHAFGNGGSTIVDVPFIADISVKNVAVQSDGKTVVAGSFPGGNDAAVLRYTVAGQLDPTFGTGGLVTIKNVKSSRIDSVTLLSGGRIQIGGQDYLRLTSAGKLDTTYGGGDGIMPSILAGDRRAIQADYTFADGSVVELGSHNPTSQNRVYKYKADGSLDTSFGAGGSFNLATIGQYQSGAVTADSAGRIYVSYLQRDATIVIVRLTSTGKVDKTYGVDGITHGTSDGNAGGVRAMAVLADGRLLIAYRVFGDKLLTNIDVYSASGTLQQTNGTGLTVLAADYFDVHSITQAKDGTVYLGGTYRDAKTTSIPTIFNAAVVHLNADLSLDTKYSANKDGVGGFSVNHQDTPYITSGVASDGTVVLVGGDAFGNNLLVRLTADTVATGLTYSTANSGLVVTGSSGADQIRLVDDSAGDSRSVALDDNGLLSSADSLYFTGISARPRFVFNLGAGDDELLAGDARYAITVNAGDGDNYVAGTTGADSITTGSGRDVVFGGGNGDTIHGGSGDDGLSAGNFAVIYGEEGSDSLSAGYGTTLYGGDGNDVLYDGQPDPTHPSTLDGGAGTDDAAQYGKNDKLVSIEELGQLD